MVLKILQSFRLAQNIILLKDRMNKDKIIVMNMCGRGDKDIFTIADELNIKI